MDKRFWAVIAAIVIIFGGIIVVSNHSKNTSGKDTGAKASNNVRGDLKSTVTVVEYGDYQCPVCEGYFPITQQVQQKYNDTVKFQFRNLPLLQIHQNAFAAARAAESAANQGKFWEMHDALYAQQNYSEWTTSKDPQKYFDSYAQALKLDQTKFDKDFASSAINDRINADINAFKATGRDESTPSFFVNGKYHANSEFVDSSTGVPTVAGFSKVIDAALKSAK